jgi:hypothetical protein
MALTYTQLVTAVQNICENTFATVDMNLFIQQAEQRIYNTVQLPVARKVVSTPLTINSPVADAPADFLAVFSFAVVAADGSYSYLLNKDQNFIREAYPSPTVTGTPKHYALTNPTGSVLRFIFGPTPSAALATELQYFAYPPSIVTANTSWLGDNFESVLLNGTLVEAIRFMKGEPDMVQMYQDMYLQSIALLKNLTDGKERSDTYRSGQTRAQVS